MGQLTLCSALLLAAMAAGCDDGNRGRSQTGTAPIETPSVLADGSMPAPLPVGLRRFRGRPVLGAKELSARSVPMRSNCLDPALRERATFSRAWLSTDGLTRQYVVERSPGVRLVACDAIRHQGRWLRCGLGHASSLDPGQIETAGGGLSFVCDDLARATSFMWVGPPRTAMWTLVDHGSYWLAYRSSGRRLLRVSKAGRAFHLHVVYLGRRARLVRERIVTGAVAG